MSGQMLPVNFDERQELVLPASGVFSELKLDMTYISEAKRRIFEAKVVNPASYVELEHTYNEGYRQAKRNLTMINYEITKAEKALREAKSRAILDEYPTFLKDNKLKDNSTVRDAFLERQADYVTAHDRIDSLKALSELLEGSYIRYFENVSRYMRKEMDLIVRSGVNSNKYVR